MASWWTSLLSNIPRLTPTAAIDVLCVAFLIYQFISIVRGRRAAHILTGLGLMLAVYVVATWARLELLRGILATLAPYTAFALIVMFQSDIRRLLARLGRRRVFGFAPLQRREVADEILLAVGQLAAQQIGALIVVERHIGLRTFVESGVSLDARLSRDLLMTVFHPGALLHDGAVIVQGDRIAAAACFLPLTTNPALSSHLGTRHRAGIGVTEEADCIAIIVSEENGHISVARFGEIEMNVSAEHVRERLTEGRRELRTAEAGAPPLRQTSVHGR
jgi:diadenylate cyclase